MLDLVRARRFSDPFSLLESVRRIHLWGSSGPQHTAYRVGRYGLFGSWMLWG